MDKKERLAEVALRVKDSFSLRQLMMVLIVVMGAMANIVTDWINVDFDPGLFHNPAYWISLVLGQGAIIVIMLSVRSFMIDREEKQNASIRDRRMELSSAHCELVKLQLTDKFDDYVYVKNRMRKLTAYMNKMQRKIFATRFERRRKSLEAKMSRGKEKIDYIHQRYNKIKIVQIFSHTRLTGANDESLSDGYGLSTAKMLANKVVSVIAFGVLASTLTFQPNAFGWGMVVSSIMKLFQVVFGIYSGGSEGVNYVKGSLLSALENRSKFVQSFVVKNMPDNELQTTLEQKRQAEEESFAIDSLKARDTLSAELTPNNLPSIIN